MSEEKHVNKRLCEKTLSYRVVEGADYKLALQRANGDATGLYSVVVHGPTGVNTIFVLAENEEGAESQAYCVLGMFADKDRGSVVIAKAVRVPLYLRGWSRNEF